jgi:hypothetical protein
MCSYSPRITAPTSPLEVQRERGQDRIEVVDAMVAHQHLERLRGEVRRFIFRASCAVI